MEDSADDQTKSAPVPAPSNPGDSEPSVNEAPKRAAEDEDMVSGPSQAQATGSNGRDARPKRRKVTKQLERKFICAHDGCDKRYSRAEHLHRHRLNHNPKQIFACDYNGCERRFVRQDLLTRHKKRHVRRKSGLVRTTRSRYDLDVTNNTSSSPEAPKAEKTSRGKATRRDSTQASSSAPTSEEKMAATRPPPDNTRFDYPVPLHHNPQHIDMPIDPRLAQDQPPSTSVSAHPYGFGSFPPPQAPPVNMAGPSSLTQPMQPPLPTYSNPRRNSVAGPQYRESNSPRQSRRDSVPSYSAFQHSSTFPMPRYPTPQSQPPNILRNYYQDIPQQMPYLSPIQDGPRTSAFSPPIQQQMPSFSSIAAQPFPHHSPMRPMLQHASPTLPAGHFSQSLADVHGPLGQSSMSDELPGNYSMPVFNNDIYNNAPFGSNDEFYNWMFEPDATLGISPAAQGLMGQDFNHKFPMFDLETSPQALETSHQGHEQITETTSLPQAVPKEIPTPRNFESHMAPDRRRQFVDFVIDNFHDTQQPHVTKERQKILIGEHDRYPHVLSLPMIETYLSCFWSHVHQQLPILHRPTFTIETTPNLLLCAMIALGASNLDKSYPLQLRQASSDLSFFLAWHTRFRIYQEVDFGPPAKLWIFQALLLLEIFEKLFSKRSLHERAHVHHSTTLTLMRRGSSLVGRYAMDFPPFIEDPTRTPPGPNGSINIAGYNTPDADWNTWISTEATRRIAFAAFIIDTTHANMFGHSAVMVAHEMRIPLPCAEAMWSASSMDEVKRLRSNLDAAGFKQVPFLEALKKTLNGQQVRTNTFGRVSIMAGLLSVSWHMKMQDVRVSSVGVGKRGSWGSQLLHAFDFWKLDFDSSLAKSQEYQTLVKGGDRRRRSVEGVDQDNVFESRTVLHHLAHMAMHCDVVDCQMYAGATRLLGRVIEAQDRQAAAVRMKDNWAPTARARDATFYAIRFLAEVLLPDADEEGAKTSSFDYSARDDFLLNRPWVLYYAALVVWAYGFALDGPLVAPPICGGLKPVPDPPIVPAVFRELIDNEEAKARDLHDFLHRVGKVKSPEELTKIKGRNASLGLLVLLAETFLKTRWELLHEAAGLLRNAAGLLVPGLKFQ